VAGSRGQIRKIVTREIGSLIHCLFRDAPRQNSYCLEFGKS